MSLADQLTYLKTQNTKAAGYLIKDQDWNGFVNAVIEIGTTLGTYKKETDQELSAINENIADNLDPRIEQLETSFLKLLERTSQLENNVKAIQRQVTPLSGFYKLTMETKKNYFAMGQVARITAKVTDLYDQPISVFGNQLPWIDFVATWGRIRPVPGFQSKGGADDRTISVQVNQAGIAQVFLRVENTEGLSEDEENAVAASLDTNVAESGLSIADTIMARDSSPADNHVKGAFRLISREYDSPRIAAMQNFADSYYLKMQNTQPRAFAPSSGKKWNEYRSTILAFVKNDSQSQTPDQTRGVSSIQITFRDWIPHWICDYFKDIKPLEESVTSRFAARIDTTFEKSIEKMEDEVKTMVRHAPAIGKQKNFMAMQSSLDKLELSIQNPPEFIDKLSVSLQNGISVQQSLDRVLFIPCRLETPGPEQPAFEAFTRTTAFTASAHDKATMVKSELESAHNRLTNVTDSVSQLDQRIISAENKGQDIRNTLTAIEDQVVGIDVTKPAELQQKIGEIQSNIGSILSEIINRNG